MPSVTSGVRRVESYTTLNLIHAFLIPPQVSGVGYNSVGEVRCGGQLVDGHTHPSLSKVLEVGCLCNDAEIHNGMLHGSPTEGAILACAMKVGITGSYVSHSICFMVNCWFINGGWGVWCAGSPTEGSFLACAMMIGNHVYEAQKFKSHSPPSPPKQIDFLMKTF